MLAYANQWAAAKWYARRAFCYMDEAQRMTAKARLETALIRLMDEKPFPEITVTELAARAQVARVSFYRSFSSTADVLDTLCARLADEMNGAMAELLEHPGEEEMHAFLLHYLQGVKRHSGTQRPACALNRGILAAGVSAKIGRTKRGAARYDAAAKLGVIASVAGAWADSGLDETPQEMAAYIMDQLKRL